MCVLNDTTIMNVKESKKGTNFQKMANDTLGLMTRHPKRSGGCQLVNKYDSTYCDKVALKALNEAS